MNDLSKQSILVTGASSGIGAALCERLLKEGATVLGLCRKIGKIPSGVIPISCDLTQPERIPHAFNIAREATPSIHGVINNAGIALLARVSDGDPAQFAEMWSVNVHGLAIVCQEALKIFPETGGRIVNVSSMSGHRVPPTGGFYAPTKFAVKALTESLRCELAADNSPHQVATVSPGFVDTPLLDHYFKGREDSLAELRAGSTMLKPEDIAEAILSILKAPTGVNIGDIQLRPAGQKA